MDNDIDSAVSRAFGTPELLEQILLCLLDDLLPLTDREDPRSVRTHHNARTLKHLLRCSEVNHTFHQTIRSGSKRLQRALFLLPDDKTSRSWEQATSPAQIAQYYRAPSSLAPVLNPIVQVTFAPYHFRYWHLSYHCAYLIITRRDLPPTPVKGSRRSTVSNMLLSQPPCTALEATIWEEKDESKEYVGRTTALSDPFIRCEEGLTVGTVHERVGEMFREHGDVAAIKLTTL